MKRLVAALLLIGAFLLLWAYFVDSDAYFHGRVRLSSLDDEQCKQFVLDQGITIPEEFSGLNFQYFFSSIEDDPDISFIYGHTPLVIFLEEIRDAVNAYYGIKP